ncbi:uncharacterized protein LY79DRAFT_670290 [Colletotrichum navitas]|uniref:Uncharacterized protein n=1 Tax=Colletotrichum navitas TaxID=681940 RepID=A0AAD8V508_9PEZI|nr:uncharacterized protein LY79DRAFT_670290 [Colletotrichum navitas]KAK1589894.1 hypothetical protein LY79DRAFT_670290 [Colletotrichum navitas]
MSRAGARRTMGPLALCRTSHPPRPIRPHRLRIGGTLQRREPPGGVGTMYASGRRAAAEPSRAHRRWYGCGAPMKSHVASVAPGARTPASERSGGRLNEGLGHERARLDAPLEALVPWADAPRVSVRDAVACWAPLTRRGPFPPSAVEVEDALVRKSWLRAVLDGPFLTCESMEPV